MKKALIALMIFVILILMSQIASADLINASMISKSDGSYANILYESSTHKAFRDGLDVNSPFTYAIVCADASADLSGKSVAYAYVLGYNDISVMQAQRISNYPSDSTTFAPLGTVTDMGDGTYCANTSDVQIRLPSSGLVVTAYPGYLGLVVDTNENNVTDVSADKIIRMTAPDTYANFHLVGNIGTPSSSFSVTSQSSIESSYDQTTGNVTVNVNTGYGYTGSSTVTVFQTSEPLIAGVCNETIGEDCVEVHSTSVDDSSLDYHTGIVSPPDTEINNKNFLVNGIYINNFCIGPQLEIDSVLADPDQLLAGEATNITVEVINNGNVNVTTNFDITTIEEGPSTDQVVNITTVTQTLEPSGTYLYKFEVTPSESGSYIYRAIVNDTEAGIATCGSAHDNSTDGVSTESVVIPYIWIDGVLDGNFSTPGKFYNITVQLNDSDNSAPSTFANWTLRIYEKGGYNLLGPLQYNNDTDGFSGIFSISEARVLLDDVGTANVTVVPTGNLALNTLNGNSDDQYIDNFENYSLVFKVYDDAGDDKHILYKGMVYSCSTSDCEAPFTFTNSTIFDLHTNIDASDSLFHNVSTYNADEAENIWNKLRQMALSITKILKT